jgi:hypothetical protein
VQKLVGKLSYAGNEAARRYLNGEIDRPAAVEYLQRWAMSPKDRAEQRTRFFDEYRSYVINYNFGRIWCAKYVEKRGGRWTVRRIDGRCSEICCLRPGCRRGCNDMKDGLTD